MLCEFAAEAIKHALSIGLEVGGEILVSDERGVSDHRIELSGLCLQGPAEEVLVFYGTVGQAASSRLGRFLRRKFKRSNGGVCALLTREERSITAARL